MKKQFKTKLVLNSQTIRRLREDGLQGIHGGIPVNNSDDICVSLPCPTRAGCGGRACG